MCKRQTPFSHWQCTRIRPHKGQTSLNTSNASSLSSEEAQRIQFNRFGLARMEKYYVSFKEKRSIHAEAQIEVESFKNSFPDIYYQIGMRDWGPLTIPGDPYFPEMLWEFYASYKVRQRLQEHKGRTDTLPCLPSVWVRGQEVPITLEAINSLYWAEAIQQHSTFHRKVDDKANQFEWVANIIAMRQPQWSISRGLIHRYDLKFEARMRLDLVCARLIPSQNTTEVPIEVSILISCIMDHVHINAGEIIADQFKRRAKQQATSLAYLSLLSMLCVRASYPLFHPLDKTMWADGVITLATKTDRDALAMEQEKGTENRTPPAHFVPSNTPAGQFQAVAAPATTPPNFLKLA
ncbi:hypothetical protein HAX54_038997 [Datura stramonium]|uniref:Putative plant transposon protein domain-containing protein n=1 Tax=Datura stramonium TaxID=4076 RepID=A0ABS8VND1_DATST|nr:hypothetical protein [Datura stramonium]